MFTKFPQATQAVLKAENPKSVSADRYAQSIWVQTTADTINQIIPFADEFEFATEHEGKLIPIIIRVYTLDIRTKLQKLLRAKAPTGGKQQETINGELRSVHINDTPDESGYIVQTKEAQQDPTVLQLIAESQILVENNAYTIVATTKHPPVYAKKIRVENNLYPTGEEVIDNRSSTSTPSLLATNVRTVLESYGNIVFESNPENASKLIICIRNIHGTPGHTPFLEAVNPEQTSVDYEHHANIMRMINGIKTHSKTVHFYGETLSTELTEPEMTQVVADTLVKVNFPALMRTEAFQQILSDEDVHYLTQIISTQLRSSDYLAYLHSVSNNPELVRGDGRMLNGVSDREATKGVRQDIVMGNVIGGVGTASHVIGLMTQEKERIFLAPQSTIAKQIFTRATPDTVSVVVYGAGHFVYGKSEEDYILKFEDYFAQIPNAQIIVVEEKNEQQYDNEYRLANAKVSKLTVEKKCALFVAEKEIATIMRKIEFTCLQLHYEPSDTIKLQDLKRLLQTYAELMQTMKDALNPSVRPKVSAEILAAFAKRFETE